MTGLDGYFSSETYSEFFAVPGISGHDAAHVLAQADHLYEQRRNDVGSFLKGDINDAVSARLAKDQFDGLWPLEKLCNPFHPLRHFGVRPPTSRFTGYRRRGLAGTARVLSRKGGDQLR